MPHYTDKEQNRAKVLIRRCAGKIDFKEIYNVYRWGGDVGVVRCSYSEPYVTLLDVGCGMYDISRQHLIAASLVAFEDPTYSFDQSYKSLIEMAIDSGIGYDTEHPGLSPEQILQLAGEDYSTEFCLAFGVRSDMIRIPFASYPYVGPEARCVYGTVRKSWTDEHGRNIGFLPSILDYRKMVIISDAIESGSCVTRGLASMIGLDTKDWEALVKYETGDDEESIEKGAIMSSRRIRKRASGRNAFSQSHGMPANSSDGTLQRVAGSNVPVRRASSMVPERIEAMYEGPPLREFSLRDSSGTPAEIHEIQPAITPPPAAAAARKSNIFISTAAGRMVAVASSYVEERFGLALQSVVIVGLVVLVMMPIIVYVLIATIVLAVILVYMNAKPRALDVEDTAETMKMYHENHKKMSESIPKPVVAAGLVSKEAVASAQQISSTAMDIGNWFTTALSQVKGKKKK